MNTTTYKKNTRHNKGGDSDARSAITIRHGDSYQCPDTYKTIFPHVSPPGHEEIDDTCYDGHEDGPGLWRKAVPFDLDQPRGDIGEQRYSDPAGVKTKGPPDRGDDPQRRIGQLHVGAKNYFKQREEQDDPDQHREPRLIVHPCDDPTAIGDTAKKKPAADLFLEGSSLFIVSGLEDDEETKGNVDEPPDRESPGSRGEERRITRGLNGHGIAIENARHRKIADRDGRE